MISIIDYLTEQTGMSLAQLQQSRANLLNKKISDSNPPPINAPYKISSGVTSVNKPTSVDVEPNKIDADEWTQKFGGAAKKVIRNTIENK